MYVCECYTYETCADIRTYPKTLMFPLGLLLMYPQSWNIYTQTCTYVCTNMCVCKCYMCSTYVWTHARIQRRWCVLLGCCWYTVNHEIYIHRYVRKYIQKCTYSRIYVQTCTCVNVICLNHMCAHTHASEDADVSSWAVANVPSIMKYIYTDM